MPTISFMEKIQKTFFVQNVINYKVAEEIFAICPPFQMIAEKKIFVTFFYYFS